MKPVRISELQWGVATDLASVVVADFESGTDVTIRLQSLLDAQVRANGFGGKLIVPSGIFYISSSIVFGQIAGQYIVGQGEQATRFIWRGAALGVMFSFNRAKDCGLWGCSIEVDAATTMECGVRLYNSTLPLAGNVVPGQLASNCSFEHVFFKLDSRSQDGVQIVLDPAVIPSDPTAIDAKNDHHVFNKVQIQGYFNSAVVINGDQSVLHQFMECVFQGGAAGVALYGINTAREHPLEVGTNIRRPGSFLWFGKLIAQNNNASLYLARTLNWTLIDGMWIEKGSRIVQILKFAEDVSLIDRFPLTIRNVNFQAAEVDPIPPDGEIIQLYGSGPFRLEQIRIGKQISTDEFRIRFQTREDRDLIQVNNGFHFEDCTLSTAETTDFFVAQYPTNVDGYASYRHLQTNNTRPLVTIEDNGLFLPLTAADWEDAGLPVPRCWYRANGTALDLLGTGSEGLQYDCQQKLQPRNLSPTGDPAPLYRQARAGFVNPWSGFTAGTADQRFILDENVEFDCNVRSMAFGLGFSEVTLSANNEYLCSLGAGTIAPGGGPSVVFNNAATGLMRLNLNGVNTPGTFDYRTANNYGGIFGYQRTAGGIFSACTAALGVGLVELFANGTPSLVTGNNVGKGLGTGSTAGLLTAGYSWNWYAVWLDEDAEEVIAMQYQALRTLGYV